MGGLCKSSNDTARGAGVKQDPKNFGRIEEVNDTWRIRSLLAHESVHFEPGYDG